MLKFKLSIEARQNLLASNSIAWRWVVWPARPIPPLPFYMLRFICEGEGSSNSCYIPCVITYPNVVCMVVVMQTVMQ